MSALVGVEGIELPTKPLSNKDIEDASKQLDIKNFRGAFLRDTLPSKPLKECGILNLDKFLDGGTHWACWSKKEAEKFVLIALVLNHHSNFKDILRK